MDKQKKLFESSEKFLKVIVLDSGEILCNGNVIGFEHEISNEIYDIVYKNKTGNMHYINQTKKIIRC